MTSVNAGQRVSIGNTPSARVESTLVACSPAFFDGLSAEHLHVVQSMYAAALKTAVDRVAREDAFAAAVAMN